MKHRAVVVVAVLFVLSLCGMAYGLYKIVGGV